MDKKTVEAMATKFSENFAISMLKKHRKFCRRGLTHLNATHSFKNRSDLSMGPPCKSKLLTQENMTMKYIFAFHQKYQETSGNVCNEVSTCSEM